MTTQPKSAADALASITSMLHGIWLQGRDQAVADAISASPPPIAALYAAVLTRRIMMTEGDDGVAKLVSVLTGRAIDERKKQ